ncbi:M20 family metallopeptidase [Clostridium transplantifaecale]|uniref:M20 family metallopeptidase n=1 Tax=Clostridium transplantifaecale TaxID=2479838 RepID=UPI0013DE45CB|nr:M20 family metallopeptidase [Clostridium transplantifaecale]
MCQATEREKQLLEQVDVEGAIQFLQKIVQTDSQNPPGNEMSVAQIIKEKLDEIGLVTEIQEVEKGRFNVLGLLPGENDEQLLFNGHMDTVKIGNPELWTKLPLGGQIEDGKLYGRGSCDMKSGLAAMIFALEAIVKSRITPKKSILFTAVIDEEVFFKGTQALIDAGKLKKCTRAYISEPTSVCIATSLQGAAEFTARTYGKASHCGMAENGINAIIPMADFATELNALNEKLKKKGAILGFPVNPSLNVGSIQGGVDVLLVPDYCEMHFDRQVFPGEDMQEAIEEIRTIFDGVCAKYNAKSELTCNQYFNYWKADKEHPAAQSAIRCHEIVTGKQPEDILFRAYAEVEMIANQGIPGVIYGPGSILQAHRPDEYVLIEEFVTAIKTYTLIGYEFIS